MVQENAHDELGANQGGKEGAAPSGRTVTREAAANRAPKRPPVQYNGGASRMFCSDVRSPTNKKENRNGNE